MYKIVRFFSKKKKREGSSINKELAIAAGAGAGYIGSKSLQGKLGKDLVNSRNESKELEKKLVEEAKSLGVEVKHNPGFGNSAYTGNAAWQRKIGDLVKKIPGYEEAQIPEAKKKLLEDAGHDKIHLGGLDSLKDADVLSHELGHAKLSKSGRSKNLVGKVSHKLMTPAKIAGSRRLAGLNGFRSGFQAAKAEAEGKKESAVSRHSSWALPAISHGIVVTGEGAASHEGLKSLKAHGADAKYLKNAKGRLGKALGTYALGGGMAVASGVGSRQIGKIVGRSVYGKPGSKKKKEK